MRQQHSAGLGQTHPTRGAVKQLLAQLAFQPQDLLAYRRLRDERTVRRTSEIALLRDRKEIGEMPKLHKLMISRRDT